MTALLIKQKVIIFSLMMLTVCGISSLPISAETIYNDQENSDYEIFEMEENFMEVFKDIGNCVNVKYKIYSEDNRLVRCGPEKSDMIKELIKRADFLTEVGGVKIYRLNK
jgi:hypothetical protein